MNPNQTREPKKISSGEEARNGLLYGAEILAKTVTRTMGPRSGIVILDRFAGLLATKDGVTVAREVELGNPLHNMGCQILKEACLKVNDIAGDGTTTTACLAAAIVRNTHKSVMAGLDLVHLLKGIKEAASYANSVLEAMTLPVETPQILERVAWISSNSDAEVAKALTDACLAVGKDGTVVIEDGESRNIELVFKEGMEIEQGPSSTHFLKGEVERTLESCLVAVVPGILSRPEDVIPIMEEASQFPDNPLLLIAERIEGTALSTMVMNDEKNVVKCVGMGGNGLGMHRREVLKDIAALAGCEVADADTGFKHTEFQSEWFGSFRKIVIGSKKTVIHSYGEAKETIDARVATLKAELDASVHDYDRDRLSERIAKLRGGFCVVRAGGTTEAEIKERRARIEDTLGAVQSALREGVLPGGGTAFLTAHQDLYERGFEDGPFGVGQKALADSLLAPLKTIAENSQKNGDVVVHMVTSARREVEESEDAGWIGWDAAQDQIRDLGEKPLILDPSLVSRSALEAAVSVSTTLLSAETSISNIKR